MFSCVLTCSHATSTGRTGDTLIASQKIFRSSPFLAFITATGLGWMQISRPWRGNPSATWRCAWLCFVSIGTVCMIFAEPTITHKDARLIRFQGGIELNNMNGQSKNIVDKRGCRPCAADPWDQLAQSVSRKAQRDLSPSTATA